MKITKLKYKTATTILFWSLLPSISSAETCGGFINPIGICSIEELIGGIISGLTLLLAPILVLAFIYSGFLFIKSQGNPGEIENAKKAFLYSAIGAALIIGANVIFAIITDTISKTLGGL